MPKVFPFSHFLPALIVFIAIGARAETADETAIAHKIADIFEKVMRAQHAPGAATMKRPVFGKASGCVQARFDVDPQLPSEFRVGVFSAKSYPAWVRFSNDGPPRPDSDKAARGMAIKLVGVPGAKILEGEEKAQTQDFIMENHPVFFVDTANEFLDFTAAALDADPKKFSDFEATHPQTPRILDDMDRNLMADPLDGQYWTPTPYKLGAHAIKYMVKPCEPTPDTLKKPMADPNFLRLNMAAHLKAGDTCMAFYVQTQTDEESMPIDKASILWSEEKSPFVRAATLTIAKGQNVDAKSRDTLCENLSFNGWHSLPEHAPLGSLNFARKIVYKQMADARRKYGGIVIAEPTEIKKNE